MGNQTKMKSSTVVFSPPPRPVQGIQLSILVRSWNIYEIYDTHIATRNLFFFFFQRLPTDSFLKTYTEGGRKVHQPWLSNLDFLFLSKFPQVKEWGYYHFPPCFCLWKCLCFKSLKNCHTEKNLFCIVD